MKRLFIVPRRAGNARSDWYPWLGKRLLAMKPALVNQVTTLDMPRPEKPCIDNWVGTINQALGTDIEAIRDTYLVGHSVGCLAILHALARMETAGTVAGVLCVGGWWELDTPNEALQCWLDTPLNHAAVIPRAKRIVTLISDNDPITVDWRKNRTLWQKRVNAKVIVAPHAGHFMNGTEPAVLDTLLNHLL